MLEPATKAERKRVLHPRRLDLQSARGRIRLDTILDVAAWTDTIVGSFGSQAVNAAGEMIGANFESTLLTQRYAYGYDPDAN